MTLCVYHKYTHVNEMLICRMNKGKLSDPFYPTAVITMRGFLCSMTIKHLLDGIPSSLGHVGAVKHNICHIVSVCLFIMANVLANCRHRAASAFSGCLWPLHRRPLVSSTSWATSLSLCSCWMSSTWGDQTLQKPELRAEGDCRRHLSKYIK